MNIEEYTNFIKSKSFSEVKTIKCELKEDIKDLKQKVKKMKKTQFIIKYKYLKKLFSKKLVFINPDVVNKLKTKQECLEIVNSVLSKQK